MAAESHLGPGNFRASAAAPDGSAADTPLGSNCIDKAPVGALAFGLQIFLTRTTSEQNSTTSQLATLRLRCGCCPGPWQRPFFSAQFQGRSSHIEGIQILNAVPPGGFHADPQGGRSPRHGHDRAGVTSPVTTWHDPDIPPSNKSTPRNGPGPAHSKGIILGSGRSWRVR